MRTYLYILLILVSSVLSGCYMTTGSNTFYTIDITGNNVLFLLDTSGSMEGRNESGIVAQKTNTYMGTAAETLSNAIGLDPLTPYIKDWTRKETTKLGAAKRQLIPAVRGLKPYVRFNLYMFGGSVTKWSPTLVPSGTANTNAMAYSLQTLSASGDTPASEALKKSFEIAEIDTIFFLSDGQPTDRDSDRILADIRQWNANDRVTIYTVGIGEDQDENFLCQMAEQNNGVYIKTSGGFLTDNYILKCQSLRATVGRKAVQSKKYVDTQGRTVVLSHGDLAFADEVVSFNNGTPSASGMHHSGAEQAIGIPDFQGYGKPGATSLGCGGTLIVKFTDNVLIDVAGDDLHIFEVGEAVESMQVAISRDGNKWIELGEISGGKASVDIASAAVPGEAYYYVRLTDMQSECSGQWPGADIDAVAAMGTGERMSLRSAVLFDFDKFTLKPEARTELSRVTARIKTYPDARIVIAGHTDNEGSRAYNQELSEKRAIAVQRNLTKNLNTVRYRMESRGYGESSPIDTNETEQGRKHNRRVEVLILPL